MRRLKNPAIFVFVLCLLGSLAVHLPIYSALGVLAKVMSERLAALASQRPVEIEFTAEAAVETLEEPPAAAPAERVSDPPAVARTQAREEPEPERERQRPTPDREEPQPAAEVQPPAEVQVLPPRPPTQSQQAIAQRSRDPNVAAPDNARFIADENQQVEEETVAQLRNYQQDDPEPASGASQAGAGEEEGNAEETEIADMRDMEGSDARTATEAEAQLDRPREASAVPPPDVAATGNATDQSGGEERQGVTAREAQAVGGGEPEAVETIEVTDSAGTFVVEVAPDRAVGEGAGDAGGAAESEREQRARRGQAGRGRGAGQTGPDLRVSWQQFEDVYGQQQLDQEREAYVEERRSRMRGSGHAQRWREFRAAIENFVPNVRPGNQTALNAAASPFANYLAHVHRRIHRQFADRFLRGLPAGGTSPFADRTLMSKLEIILNRDGTVHRVGVVKTSGFLPFDYGAFAAVMRGQPYPEAPTQILSGDGRVYMHWAFYRNERQCGTFNAEPYILPHPPGTPRPGGPLRDGPEWGGVVPQDARPTWGTEGEQRGSDTPPATPGPSTPSSPTEQPGAPQEERQEEVPPEEETDPSDRPPPRRPPPFVPSGSAVG